MLCLMAIVGLLLMYSLETVIKKAAFLVESGFCERELTQAQEALREIGFDCRVISSENEVVRGWNEEKCEGDNYWGKSYAVDSSIKRVLAANYDVLVIPGGHRSIDKLKLDNGVKSFISAFLGTGKPVIAYNYAIDLLMHTDLVAGYSVAAKNEICDTVKNVGGRCAAPSFVVSKNLITLSRYRDVNDKIQNAVKSIIDGKPYIEKIVSSDNMPYSHKVA